MTDRYLHRTPRRRDDLVLSSSGDRSVLRQRDGAEVCVLNATAAALWELCDGDTTPAEMAEAVSTLFEVSVDEAAVDVDRALVGLDAAGALERRPADEI